MHTHRYTNVCIVNDRRATVPERAVNSVIEDRFQGTQRWSGGGGTRGYRRGDKASKTRLGTISTCLRELQYTKATEGEKRGIGHHARSATSDDDVLV